MDLIILDDFLLHTVNDEDAYSGVRGLIDRSQKSVLVSGHIGVESPAAWGCGQILGPACFMPALAFVCIP